MVRAMLRDDYASPGGYPDVSRRVRLSDDSHSAVPAVLGGYEDAIPGDGSTITHGPDVVFPKITVRGRFSTGYDDDGNPVFAWADVVRDQPALMWEERQEGDERANTSTVTATFTFLYPYSEPEIRESATVLTDDGRRWDVTKLVRAPDRYTATVTRIDDGA